MVERGDVQDICRQSARLLEAGEDGRKALRPGATLGMGGWSEDRLHGGDSALGAGGAGSLLPAASESGPSVCVPCGGVQEGDAESPGAGGGMRGGVGGGVPG